MIALGPEQCLTIVKTAALHRAANDVLSAAEVELLWDLSERALTKGQAAEATEAEWCKLGAALLKLQEAMRMRGLNHVMEGGKMRVVIGAAKAPVVLGEVQA